MNIVEEGINTGKYKKEFGKKKTGKEDRNMAPDRFNPKNAPMTHM